MTATAFVERPCLSDRPPSFSAKPTVSMGLYDAQLGVWQNLQPSLCIISKASRRNCITCKKGVWCMLSRMDKYLKKDCYLSPTSAFER